jgi:hypothetical protein
MHGAYMQVQRVVAQGACQPDGLDCTLNLNGVLLDAIPLVGQCMIDRTVFFEAWEDAIRTDCDATSPGTASSYPHPTAAQLQHISGMLQCTTASRCLPCSRAFGKASTG